MGLKLKDLHYLKTIIHTEGILPSQINIPRSFRDHPSFNADLGMVKLSKDLLKHLPQPVRTTFKKLYYARPIIGQACKRCGVCVKSCPVKAIHWQDDGFPLIDTTKCIKCMCCHEMCPYHAIDIQRSLVAKVFG